MLVTDYNVYDSVSKMANYGIIMFQATVNYVSGTLGVKLHRYLYRSTIFIISFYPTAK